MSYLKNWLVCLVAVLAGAVTASAFTANDAATAFTAYNNAFLQNGYYPGWWTGAEEIEMAEDAYDNLPTAARKTIVANACAQFAAHQGSNWTLNDSHYNEYNDDISWAVIAFSRGYLITGNTAFRDIAKVNWDAMYNRAWDTNYFGGGLFWRQSDKASKNACIEGPAAIAACYLYNIYGDTNYLTKAQAIYAWERKILVHTDTGAIDDSIGTNGVHSTWASTYNQGTFIGAANFLYRATGLPFYYQDAIMAGKYAQNSMTSGSILPEYGSGSDLSGFNGIFARWMARFAKDQNLWSSFGPWLTLNANAAWSIRNANNLAWQNWKTPTGTNVPGDWGCSAAVVIMQVANPSPSDALQISPSAGFTAVSQCSLPPNPISTDLVLTNTGASAFNWSLANTSVWLSVSTSSGTLSGYGSATVKVSLIPSATLTLPAGRYYASVTLNDLTSGVASSRLFTLVVSRGSAPIAMTGYNAGTLAPNTATASAPKAAAFDIPNNRCFYQAGLNGSTRGLPPDGVFTSQLDATNVFQFMPYGITTNVLMMGYTYPSSGTLTLASPQAYKTLAILACSANAGGGIGTFVLNFTNGTHSQTFSFNAQDWFNTTANVAIQGMGRFQVNSPINTDNNGPINPNLYQTTLNLTGLGLDQRPIQSIAFTKPANSGAQQSCGVFAVSGFSDYRQPVITRQPAPASLYKFTGSSNNWSVAVNAALPVSYHWCLNGTVLPLATNSTCQLNNLQITNSGNYTVVISNTFGVVTSSIVSLTVAQAPTYPFGQSVIADGALGYWRLDETTGTIAHDYIGNNLGAYSRVLLGQPGDNLLDTHKAARFGYLSSSNSCVTNINVDFATSSNAAFSVEAWVNGGSQSTDAGLVTKGYGSGGEQLNLDCGGNSHAFRFFVRDAGGNAHLATSSVVPDSQWHHLVGVCDQINGHVYLYVDGALAAQGTIPANSGILSSSLPVCIGSRQSGAGTAYDNQFIGYMEEVAVYGRALNSSQVLAHYQSAANRAPAFLSNPFTVASASAGQFYASTLAANASDPNGDTITFAKISGPSWLSVASNGTLTGTPFSANVGINGFVIRATDPSGLSSSSTMNLTVMAAPPIIASSSLQGNAILLSWTGGIAPYQVQLSTNLASPHWQNLGAPISVNNLSVFPTNSAAFYRVYGQ